MFTQEILSVSVPKPANAKNKDYVELQRMAAKYFQNDKSKFWNYFQAVSDAFFDPENWKNPAMVRYAGEHRETIKAVISWHHGARPKETMYGVFTSGYAC